jgi:hypothetical protein
MQFSNTQIGEMLQLLRSGVGRVMMCESIQVSYKTFLHALREEPELAQWVREAEDSRIEACEAAIFRMATMKHNSPLALRAATSYLGRRDKIEESRRVRREKARRGGAGGRGPQ